MESSSLPFPSWSSTLARLDPSASVEALLEAVQEQAAQLARHAALRSEWASIAQTQLVALEQCWARALPGADTSGGGREGRLDIGSELGQGCIETDASKKANVELATAGTRLARNAVAGTLEAQSAVFVHLPLLERLLWYTTAFTQLEDPAYKELTRALVQLLSNLITLNPELQERFWARFEERQAGSGRGLGELICRLLTSQDAGTLQATQILLLNLTKSSPERSRSLCTSSVGLRIIQGLLVLAELAAEVDEVAVEKEESNKVEHSLGVLYAIFSHFFALRLGGSLFNRLAPSEPPATGTSARTSANDHENRPVLTNAQIVLLKLFDSYLYFGAAGYGDSLAGRQEVSGQTFDFAAASTSSVMDRDCVLLISAFLRLATFAEDAMRRSGSGGSGSGESRINSADSASEPNQSGGNGDAGAGAGYGSEPDHRLVGVYKALILLLQCLISLSLAAEGRDQNPESTAQSRARGNADAQIPFEEAKPYQQEAVRVLTALRSSTNGVVERLVSFLHQTSLFAPAISPFRPTRSGPAPPDHALSSTGAAPPLPIPSDPSSVHPNIPDNHLDQTQQDARSSEPGLEPEPHAFSYVKRDLVRLLGILAYGRNADVQDRVRQNGGLYDVLNMTQLDERNPYIREHAIFALRNLLEGNQASQQIVADLKPVTAPAPAPPPGGGHANGARK